ncbi:MAG: hypothetical protein KAH10_06850 [Flavobacteriales bacterium]|nr:hypothetical protein [Flavobacteriales bacterium]
MDELLDYIMYEAHPLISFLASVILILWFYLDIIDLDVGKNRIKFKERNEAYKLGIYISLILSILFFLYSFYRMIKFYL